MLKARTPQIPWIHVLRKNIIIIMNNEKKKKRKNTKRNSSCDNSHTSTFSSHSDTHFGPRTFYADSVGKLSWTDYIFLHIYLILFFCLCVCVCGKYGNDRTTMDNIRIGKSNFKMNILMWERIVFALKRLLNCCCFTYATTNDR